MFRSIRAVLTKSRQAKAKANARRLLLESLEQRRLLSVSPGLVFASTGVTTPTAIYGPVQAGVQGLAAINVQPEGEDAVSSTTSAARQLLFAGVAGATASPTNSGLLTIIEPATDSPPDSIVSWNAPLAFGGIAGLAFDLSGRLYAAIDQGPCTPSELVELNPANGAVLRRLPIMAGSTEINIGDLAVEPGTGRLFGTRSIHDIANHAGELYVIDVDSGAATLVGDTGTGAGEGLAFASDGALYLAGTAGAKSVLYKIDPATAEPHQRDAVTGLAIPFVVLNDPTGRLKRVEGLVGHPDNGTLIATTSLNRFDGNQIVDDVYGIDLSTGLVTAQPLASPARGIFGDLAFQPSPRVLDVVYQEDFESGSGGFVIDNTGGTLPGLWHYSLGRRFDSKPSHTPISSFYYGTFETAFGEGHYVLPLDHQGTLTSAPIQLPTSSVLSFNYLLDTRPELDVDFVDVSVITADGTITQILSRADGTLPQTGRQQWRTATADLSAFACQPIQLQFSFDTGAAPTIDPEGWYIDDLMIGSTGGFCDFGDAPDDPTNPGDYPTLLVSNGARHGIVEGFHLGSAIDAELDGQPTPMADGDDSNPPAGTDDEDGVTFPIAANQTEITLYVGQSMEVSVELVNDTASSAFLDAWIDFNQDGDWFDAGELISPSEPIAFGANIVTFQVPDNAALGETFVRFRLSSTGGLSPEGPANDGEVEDYKVRIAPATNFAIDKRDDGSDAVAGGNYMYTIEVTNNGPSDSSGAEIIDTLPTGWQFVSSSNTTCMGDAASPQKVTCDVAALAAGETTTFTITTAVPANAILGTVTNSAVVVANEQDPDQNDNTETEDTDVIRVTDFAIVKRDDGSDAVPGQNYAYIIDVTNRGPSDSTGAQVIDTLPAGWTFVSASGTACHAEPSAPEMVSCEIGPLPFGANLSFTIITRVPDNAIPGIVTNQVTVTPNEVDPNLNDNTATEDTDVIGLASIGGRVFADVNGNAAQDSFEAGIHLVTLQLYEDTNGNGALDDETTPLQEITTGDGEYEFPGLLPGSYLVDVLDSTLPTGFDLTTASDPTSVTIGPTANVTVDFGYQGVVQFVTPLGAFRSDLPDDLVVPFVRPASDPIGDLLRDPQRSLGTILPKYVPYQSVTIKNTGTSAITITQLNTVIESAGISTAGFITIFAQSQLDQLAVIETQLDGLLAAEQPIPTALRSEIAQLLAGVTDPANQIPEIPAGQSMQLLLVYRPIQVALNASQNLVVTGQLPDWAPDASPEQGKSHTFARTDRVEVTTSAGATLQFQLTGGSTYDGDIADYNGIVGNDFLAFVAAVPGEQAWDPTSDVNVRYPNAASGTFGRFWPDVLVDDPSVAKESALGDFGIFNVEVLRNSRAPFLDLDAGTDARGVDYAAEVAPADLAIGFAIMTDDAYFGNSSLVELQQVRVVITNAIDGEDEVLAVTTTGTGLVVAENRIENGQRILILTHATMPETVEKPETVENYLQVLQTIRYSNLSNNPTKGVRVIEVQATGTNADFSFVKNGTTVSQSVGNIAIARLTV